MATHEDANRPRDQLALPVDRRLLLGDERARGRHVEDHGEHESGIELQSGDLPHGLLWRRERTAGHAVRFATGQNPTRSTYR